MQSSAKIASLVRHNTLGSSGREAASASGTEETSHTRKYAFVSCPLLSSPEGGEFQRLRRIKQLGVSEFVFPGATHSRFAHCIGVYHNARKLMQVVRRTAGSNNTARERVVLLAALLHDIGHGPFSHAFEDAREAIARDRGIEAIEKHEKFTARLIRAENGHIRRILDSVDAQLADQVAGLI